MLRVDPQTRALAPLGRRTLEPVSILQRYTLAELVASNPEEFFRDLGLELVFLTAGMELRAGRPTMLAADADGRVYVLAFQRKDQPLDLIDPLEEASRVARWGGLDLLRRLLPDRASAAREFLRVPPAKLNSEQGVVLIGESFDVETLSAAGWLRRRYNVSILCFRARMAVDSLSGHEYLACRDLGEEVEQIYQERQSASDDGAPWPTIAPDIADQPQPAPAETDDVDATVTSEDAGAALQADVDDALVDAAEAEAVAEPAVDRAPTPSPEAEIVVDAAPGDPLEEVLQSTSLVPASAAQEGDGDERRETNRRYDLQARRLRLDYFGRLLGARLVDFSAKGIGVEALSPLPIGAEVGISGELIGKDGSMGLDGRVKVKHCRTGEDGVSRIGLELDESALRLVENQEFFDRR